MIMTAAMTSNVKSLMLAMGLAVMAAPALVAQIPGGTVESPRRRGEGRRPRAPHPYVIGTKSVQNYLTVASECSTATIVSLGAK